MDTEADKIISAVSEHFSIPREDIMGRSRAWKVLTPRFIAIHFIRERLKLSSTVIGRIFNRDHGSILCALRSVKGWMDVDPKLKADAEAILKKLNEQN